MTKAAYPQPLCAEPEFAARRSALDAAALPRVCAHDAGPEPYHGAHGPVPRSRQGARCGKCGHAPPGGRSLRARAFPGLTHALLFFGLSWGLYLLNPFPPLRGDVAMLTAWLVCFAVSLRLRTPLRSGRNALLILFLISWLHFIVRHWSVVTPGYLLSHTLHKWADCAFAATPIFVAAGIRALLERLRARGRADEF